MKMMVFNFSSAYREQGFLSWLKQQSTEEPLLLDCEAVEGCTCYCDPAAQKEILSKLPASLPPVRWLDSGEPDETDYAAGLRSKVLRRGSGAALMAVGSLIPLALRTADAWRERTGEAVTVVHPRFLSGVDGELLEELKADHSLVITLEDGELDGGWGQRIASFYGPEAMRVLNLGISKAFHSDFNADQLLAENGISLEGLIGTLSRWRARGENKPDLNS